MLPESIIIYCVTVTTKSAIFYTVTTFHTVTLSQQHDMQAHARKQHYTVYNTLCSTAHACHSRMEPTPQEVHIWNIVLPWLTYLVIAF